MSKPRIVICPALPIKMRYTEWWPKLFTEKITEVAGGSYDVICAPYGLGNICDGKFESNDTFFKRLCEWDWMIIKFLLALNLRNEDIVLLLDCTTSGLLSAMFQTYKPCKVVGFCHGTSFNTLDIFPPTRQSFDGSCLEALDLVLVASRYHLGKLSDTPYSCDLSNMMALPDNPHLDNIGVVKPMMERPNRVCIVDRDCEQKRNKKVIAEVQKTFQVEDIHGKYDTWEDYYRALSNDFRFMLVTTNEETYGYQVHDALRCGCIPIVPHKFSFPETVPAQYMYDHFFMETRTPHTPMQRMNNVNEHFAVVHSRLNEKPVIEFWSNLWYLLIHGGNYA